MTASNTVTTTSTTRSDLGGDTGLTGFMKDQYLPGLVDTIFHDKELLNVFQPVVVDITSSGRRFVVGWDTQSAGGIGSIAEGGDFVKNVSIGGAQGYDVMKTDNLYFDFSGPATRTVQEGEGSYVDPVGHTLQSILKMYQMDVTRKLFGAGNAELAKVTSVTTANPGVITLTGPAFSETYWLNIGHWYNVVNPSAGSTQRTVDGASAVDFQIDSVTPGNKRTSAAATATMSVAYSGGGFTAADWIVRRNSFLSTGNTCLEQNGLMNLISNGSEATGGYYGTESGNNFKYVWPSRYSATTELCGKDRTTAGNEFLNSQMFGVNGVLTEDMLLTAIMENEAVYRGKPNMLICSSRAFVKYFQGSKDDRRFYTMDAMDWVGGVKGLGIQLGQTKLMLSPMHGCPSGYGFMINTGDFAIARPAGQSEFGPIWLTGEGGSIIRQKEGSDAKFASAAHDYQFVCKDPGRQCKLYGITEV
jgi:hypothetical protein